MSNVHSSSSAVHPAVVAGAADPGLATALAMLVVVPAALLSYSLPPSSTFLNQAAAVIGWGAWLLYLATVGGVGAVRAGPGSVSMLAAMALIGLGALLSWSLHLPAPLALSSFTLIVAVAGVALFAATLPPTSSAQAFQALCLALVIAGGLSALIGAIQILAPALAGGPLVALAPQDSRAVGNLRQANHLSSLLLWSVVAAIWLGERRAMRRSVAFLLSGVCVFGIVLSASRTGMVGVVVLALWGLLDRGQSRPTRTALLLTPLLYGLLWAGLDAWSQAAQAEFAGSSRFNAGGDISSSRFAIWRDTLGLIAAHPWLGVGFGEFNFAWSLTPFPQRPGAFFDHTHNLPLQFLVELGLPLGLGVLVLLAHALWRAFRSARDAHGPDAGVRRAALVMVLLMVLHSQLEYPLWYAYFLLPTAFAFGLSLRAGNAEPAAPSRASALRLAMQAGAALLLAGGAASVYDYMRVAAIFESNDTIPLAQRISDGQRSWFFAHHAHYAAATIEEHPSRAMPSFGSATHYLLDTRLMIAWATALNESGDVERARHIAQRLREFRNADSREFFAPCAAPPAKGQPLPFQCTAPTRRFDHRDFR